MPNPSTIKLDAQWVGAALPQRRPEAHKGSFGRLAVLAGSTRYRGAAVLAAAGALRAGAGIVQVASTERVCAAVAAQLPPATLLPLKEDLAGGIHPDGAHLLLAENPGVILAGCGLSNTENTARLVETLLENATCPLVLDADALNALAGHLDAGQSDETRHRLGQKLLKPGRPVILTPHAGEMARLRGVPVAEATDNQRRVAAAHAAETGCVVVLKSHITVVAAPAGTVYVNDNAGNAGLAKGGSGDVLAGIVAALAAQGLLAEKAAAAGVWLHAAAADKAAAKTGLAALSPMDLPHYLGRVLRQLGR